MTVDYWKILELQRKQIRCLIPLIITKSFLTVNHDCGMDGTENMELCSLLQHSYAHKFYTLTQI